MNVDTYLLGHRPPEQERLLQQADFLTVAFHEADAVSRMCDPPLPAWTQLFDAVKAYSRRIGIDIHVARALPRLLREAGLTDIGVRPLVYVDPPGHLRRRILEVFATNLADRLVADDLITREDLDRLGGVLSRHLDDPATTVISDLFIQAWGRKPPEAFDNRS